MSYSRVLGTYFHESEDDSDGSIVSVGLAILDGDKTKWSDVLNDSQFNIENSDFGIKKHEDDSSRGTIKNRSKISLFDKGWYVFIDKKHRLCTIGDKGKKKILMKKVKDWIDDGGYGDFTINTKGILRYDYNFEDKDVFSFKKLMKTAKCFARYADNIAEGPLYVINKKSELWQIKITRKKKYKYSISRKKYMYSIKKKKIASKVRYAYSSRYGTSSNYSLFYIRKDNTLWGMGYNKDGVLGTGNKKNRSQPVRITDNVKKLVVNEGGNVFRYDNADNRTCYVIKNDGTVFAWGANKILYHKSKDEIYMIDDTFSNTVTKPIIIAIHVVDISADNFHVAFLHENGNLCLKGESIGKKQYDLLAENVKCISMGAHTIYFITDDKKLWYYGGGGKAESFGLMNKPKSLLNNVGYAIAGHYAYYAIKMDGTVWAGIKKPKKVMSGAIKPAW